MLSKLMLLKFVFFLFDHLKTGSYRNIYCDTGKHNIYIPYSNFNLDSLCIATTQTKTITDEMTLEEKLKSIFEPILKPNMVNSWQRQWKDYFVTENTVEDKRCPGKMKRMYVR